MRMDPEEVSIMWNLGSKVQRRGSWNQGLRSKARIYIRVTSVNENQIRESECFIFMSVLNVLY